MIPRCSLSAAGAVLAAPSVLRAQHRPVRMLLGSTPDGADDTIAWHLPLGRGEHLGRTIVVENRIGASGTIAAAAVAQSAPDGDTLLFATLRQVTNRLLFRNLRCDHANAFTPICQVLEWPQILAVKNGFAAERIGAFLDHARRERVTWRDLRHVRQRDGPAPGRRDASASHRRSARASAQPRRRRCGARPRGRRDARGVDDDLRRAALRHRQTRADDRGRQAAAAAGLSTDANVAAAGVAGFALTGWCAMFGATGLAPARAALRHALAEPGVVRRLEALGSPPVGSAPGAFAPSSWPRAGSSAR
jgi:hypothetical protein